MKKKTNNYVKDITLHVNGLYTQEAVLSDIQRDAAKSPDINQAMIAAYIKNGFFKKRYDYMFTGLNTEVIDFDISWNMAWSAVIAKIAGARMSIDNAEWHRKLPGNNYTTQANRPLAQSELLLQDVSLANTALNTTAGIFTPVAPLSDITASSTSQSSANSFPLSSARTSPQPQQAASSFPLSTGNDLTMPGPNQSTISTNTAVSLRQLGESSAQLQQQSNNATKAQTDIGAQPKLSKPSGVPNTSQVQSSGNGSNVYIEDILDRVNNPPNSNLMKFRHFQYHSYNKIQIMILD